MDQLYFIYDKKTHKYLDRNLYYVNQFGIIYKVENPLPVKLTDQERYEVKIVVPEGVKNGN